MVVGFTKSIWGLNLLVSKVLSSLSRTGNFEKGELRVTRVKLVPVESTKKGETGKGG